MKKIAIVMCVIISLLSFSACTSEKEDYENVSKIENYYYVGESDSYAVTFVAGSKEEPFIVDGSAGKLYSYGKITVEVKSGYASEYSYQLAIGEELFYGTLADEIVGGNLYAEFEVGELSELSYKIIISYGDKTEEVYLESVLTEEMIKWNEAKAIAQKELSSNISEMQSEIADNYEVYVKLVYDKDNANCSWYVAYANAEQLCAVLIDPISGDITAKRI